MDGLFPTLQIQNTDETRNVKSASGKIKIFRTYALWILETESRLLPAWSGFGNSSRAGIGCQNSSDMTLLFQLNNDGAAFFLSEYTRRQMLHVCIGDALDSSTQFVTIELQLMPTASAES